MSGTTEEFTKLKAGGRFAIYAFGIYLATTFTIGCLGVIIGSPLLTLPLAMLISHPIIWIAIEIALAVTYKVAIEPLYRLVRNGKGALKEEKSGGKGVEPQKSQENTVEGKQKGSDGDSGIVPDSKPGSESTSRRNSVHSEDSGLGVGPEVITYNTAGDGNCFFHAAFGDNSSGQYKAEKAQEMRMEWHKFLSQFNDLDDARMSAPLRAQLEKIFNMFLNKPGDLTGRSDRIKELAERTSKELAEVKERVKQLKKELVTNLTNVRITSNEIESDLRGYAMQVKRLTEDEYNNQYNSEFVTCSFLNKPELYQAYLEGISSQNYFVFIEEVPILASLANIEIDVHYKNNNNDVHTVFKPDLEMINENYQKNDELWGNKERETIYLKPGHYERAEVKEVLPSSRTGSIVSLDTSSPPHTV